MKKSAIVLNILLIILVILSLLSCKECPTEPEKAIPLNITAPYVESTIVWLRISSTDSTHQKSYTVIRDSVIISEGLFIGKDTIIADRSVEPNTTYTYSVQHSDDNFEPIAVTTMDISSNDFTWEVLYFGEQNNTLQSVSIVDENDIWIVGLIEVWGWDSLDSEYDWIPYNALHWDGIESEYISITPPYTGAFDVVHSIDDTSVWFGVNYPVLFSNGEFKMFENAPGLGWMLDIWGNSLDNTFFTYYDGGIAHYNGSTYHTMNSGTTTDLHDIDGNNERVFIVGYNIHAGYDRLILEYKNGVWNKTFSSNLVNGDLSIDDYGRFYSVKVLDDVAVISSSAVATLKYYYHDHVVDIMPEKSTPLKDCWAVRKIDGNAINDLALISEGGEVVHYNGKDYVQIFDYEEEYSKSVSIYGGDFKGDVICAVGDGSGYGVVIIGRR